MLESPALGETAVIVNELGEIGIDHAILRRVDERTVLLASGCICCTLRGDLADELRDLVDRRADGEIPPFTRVVVETTGSRTRRRFSRRSSRSPSSATSTRSNR